MKYKDKIGNMDRCTIAESKNKRYFRNTFFDTKPIIRIANAIPDLMPDENRTCTFGVKNTIKKRGSI